MAAKPARPTGVRLCPLDNYVVSDPKSGWEAVGAVTADGTLFNEYSATVSGSTVHLFVQMDVAQLLS